MSLVQFEPAARFRREDLVRMAAALDAVLARCPNERLGRPGGGAGEARDWLLEVLGVPLPTARGRWRPRGRGRGRAAARRRGSVAPVVEVATGGLLEAAAQLLEAAARLHRAGRLVEAFAVEGVQGRLLEAAVGANGCDGEAPSGNGPAERQSGCA